ncbi:EEF1A lysine methyltransferase 2-like isoform X2 [Ruditapes philippinarum]|uniref:EEF1A lysine methyltransferase 2-like isoform X2 n=1 Tax=Ruditapes philippinarum TaxID=129788 RepID=UPI00295BDD45|nr:EEF1A lysine methyltransferase 2-like isoform X2 [Ruditapes philippinarum]
MTLKYPTDCRFGEETMEKVVDWFEDNEDICKEDTIIDLGSGNGMMCIELRKRGFLHLTGVDYSELAITLSKSVAKSEGFEDIEFVAGDLITEERLNPCTCLTRQYKLVLDKGTYDAISLMPGDSLVARKQYLKTVKDIMRPESWFSITSCNWTKDQLLDFFKEDFQLVKQIPFRTFQFGGQTGSTVTSLVFKLKT